MRTIHSIREKLYKACEEKQFINGLRVRYGGATDYGNWHMTIQLKASFPGFDIEFNQNKWHINTDDTLYVTPVIHELEGFSKDKLEREAKAMIDYFKNVYMVEELEKAIITDPYIVMSY